MRTCACLGMLHEQGCILSRRRADFFPAPKPKVSDAVVLTCLDCRGYNAAGSEFEAKDARCRRCGSDRMAIIPKMKMNA